MSDDAIDRMLAEISVPGKRPLRNVAALDLPKVAEGVDDQWATKPILKRLNGVETEFFAIGHLAAALGRQTVTVRSWEAKGWLPTPKYRAPQPKGTQVPGKKIQGRRLYTRQQVQTVIDAARSCGVLAHNGRDADWKKFTRAVIDGWKKMS